MDSKHKIGVVTAATLVVGLAAFGVSFLFAGVGHGSYLPFAILFPYSFLSTVVLGGGIGIVAATLMLAQFPSYGILLGRAWLRGGLRWRTTWVIVVHFLLATVCTVIFFGN